MMRHAHQMASKCDSELSLPQERVKYVVVGNPEAVVGTSTAFYTTLCTRCPEGSYTYQLTREPPTPEKPSQTFSDCY